MLGGRANGTPLPPSPRLTAITGGSGAKWSSAQTGSPRCPFWRPLPIFRDARDLLALLPRHSTGHALSLLSISQAAYHRDSATKPRSPPDGVLSCHDLTTTAGVLSPRRQLVLRMRAAPPQSFSSQTMAAAYVTVTPALAELIRYAHHLVTPRARQKLTSTPARCHRMKSQSSCAALSAASWP